MGVYDMHCDNSKLMHVGEVYDKARHICTCACIGAILYIQVYVP